MMGCETRSRCGSRYCHGIGWCLVRAAGGPAGAGGRVLSPARDPAVLRADGERAVDGAGRSQLLDDRRGGGASRAAPAAAFPVAGGPGTNSRLRTSRRRGRSVISMTGDGVLIVDETA